MEADPRVPPQPPDAIEAWDRSAALNLVARLLREVPAFSRLWKPAYDRLSAALHEVLPSVIQRWGGLSPEGRAAAIAFGSPSFSVQATQAQGEGAAYRADADRLFAPAEAALMAYESQINELLAPLGVDGLAYTLLMIDLNTIGLFRRLKEAGGVAGPWRDAFETELFRDLTGLGPADLAKTPPGQVRARMKRRSGPLGRHLKTYDLLGRVELWVKNKVFGVTQADLASQLAAAPDARESADPEGRVRKSIQDVNRLFGTSQPGRPRKGGALAYWKGLSNPSC